MSNSVTLPDDFREFLQCLNAHSVGALTLTADDFTRPVTVALGRAPYQIDIMTYIKGVEVEEAWTRRAPGVLDGVDVFFVSKSDLIANKRSVGRPEDLADIERLRDEDEGEGEGELAR